MPDFQGSEGRLNALSSSETKLLGLRDKALEVPLYFPPDPELHRDFRGLHHEQINNYSLQRIEEQDFFTFSDGGEKKLVSYLNDHDLEGVMEVVA